MTNAELSVAFFLQMAVIIAACRVVGWAAKAWLDQPQVVGEMIAGVILGPSLFGLMAPTFTGLMLYSTHYRTSPKRNAAELKIAA